MICNAGSGSACGKRHYNARSRRGRGSENKSGETSKYVHTPVVSAERNDGVGPLGNLLIGYKCYARGTGLDWKGRVQVSGHESRA